ncbi:sprT-like domain-containing protein Spartan isoform X2 [Dinothrombium tinctorium]|uniref:SprT-like domain-containing protein Spartan isoform X2 n=1 Tax=Dinothrombium tinctorium TaxID=1965070 RepID=A0A3S3NKH7_9ACAR|nr:sprT-like domain-containing protein Spartan isoform X2 [Dinothrombium tinctorium]RWS00895.1 sprT-like domain-containing protein Spartan isoform X2 [Dinothrombium tinctorium]RWS01171.1 sprT-like domain-containing protein Spartan isoform X2 [Dinothrombium tinctorium]
MKLEKSNENSDQLWNSIYDNYVKDTNSSKNSDKSEKEDNYAIKTNFCRLSSSFRNNQSSSDDSDDSFQMIQTRKKKNVFKINDSSDDDVSKEISKVSQGCIGESDSDEDWNNLFTKMKIGSKSSSLSKKSTNKREKIDNKVQILKTTDENLKKSSKWLKDENWDKIDDKIDIIKLFRQFDEQFFESKLKQEEVDVKWSGKMTRSAGLTEYSRKTMECHIKLSKPLLKLRPRKDTIETLLHEMIHAFLFVTDQDDISSHGPMFRLHQERINTLSGTKITIFHNFHEEVDLYRNNYVWRCDGICKSIGPKYGYVRRSVNRKPGTHDLWWAKHQRECGGNFVFIPKEERPAFLSNYV